MDYPIVLTPDDNGTFLVTCPDLPEVTTFGDTEEEVVANGRNAIEEAVAARMDAFSVVPRPSAADGRSAGPSLALALKLLLYWSLLDAGMTRADLMRALGWSRTSVDRLFDPRHASRIDQIEAAFAAMNRKAEVTVEAA